MSTHPPRPEKGRYRHFKGQLYEVIDIARHSETLEDLVVYRALYGDRGLWVRPLAMFTETVEHEGRRQPRFQRLPTAALSSEPGGSGEPG